MCSLNYANVVERYYTRMYSLDVMEKSKEDMCVMFHSNRVCVVTLAPSHPIIADKRVITKVDYRITDKTDRLNNAVTGKTKRGAQFLTYESPLCHVTCRDGSTFTLRACMNARLIEVNENLSANPALLSERWENDGFIAIAIPTRKNDFVKGREKLLNRNDYLKLRFPENCVENVPLCAFAYKNKIFVEDNDVAEEIKGDDDDSSSDEISK